MPAPDSTSSAKAPRRLSFRGFALKVALPGMLLLGFALFFARHRSRAQSEALLDVYRNAGYPVDIKAWSHWVAKPPVEEDATPFYEKAFGLLVELDRSHPARQLLSDRSTPGGLVSLSAEDRRTLSAHLATNAPTLAVLGEAMQYSRTDFGIDYGTGFKALLPHLGPLRNCARLWAFQALQAAEAGDAETAMKSLEGILAVQEVLKDDPTVIGFLVRVAVLAHFTRTTEYVLNRQILNADQMARLQSRIREVEPSLDLRPALALELSTGLSVFEDPSLLGRGQLLGGSAPFPKQLSKAFLSLTAASQAARHRFLELHVRLWKSLEVPFPERLEIVEAIDAEINASNGIIARFHNVLITMLLPVLPKIWEKHAGILVRLRMLDTALALERYRLQNPGPVPDSLSVLPETLLPRPLLDPFNGRPIIFERLDQGRGYRLHSVGPDRERDSPPAPDGTTRKNPDDVLFEVTPGSR